MIALAKAIDQGGELLAGTHGGGAGLHRLFGPGLGVGFQCRPSKPAEQNAGLRHDEREAVARLVDPLPDGSDGLVEAAGNDVVSCNLAGNRNAGLLSLARQAAGEPVLLAGDVVVYVPEAKRLEPARGSRTEVSYRVPAVDDHGPVAVQARDGLGVELLERHADRSSKMLLAVLVLGQDLEQVSAVRMQLLNLLCLNRSSHRLSFPLCEQSDAGTRRDSVDSNGPTGGPLTWER
jgi:hypothetical protein